MRKAGPTRPVKGQGSNDKPSFEDIVKAIRGKVNKKS